MVTIDDPISTSEHQSLDGVVVEVEERWQGVAA